LRHAGTTLPSAINVEGVHVLCVLATDTAGNREAAPWDSQ